MTLTRTFRPTSQTRDSRVSAGWENFIIETQPVFGSIAAEATFDRLDHTLVDLALLETKTPRQFLHRTLDDVLMVTPADSHAGPKFAKEYKEDMCNKVGARLKTFDEAMIGTALGTVFDTMDLTWSISEGIRE